MKDKIHVTIDPAIIMMVRNLAKKERRTFSNMVEVMLAEYLEVDRETDREASHEEG